MKIIKQISKDKELYAISECTEDNLVGFYNIALNYRSYIAELMKKPDNVLLSLAPGKDAKTVRNILTMQLNTANEYVAVWQEIINKGDDNRPQA